MLTEDQRYQILKALSLGFADTVIAEKMQEVNHMQVYNFRKKMGITSETVVENRYNTWVKMLEKGIGVDAIAKMYKVKEASVSIMLARKKGFSVTDALKKAQQRRNQQFAGKCKENGPFDWY